MILVSWLDQVFAFLAIFTLTRILVTIETSKMRKYMLQTMIMINYREAPD
jgi:hypothetical protein